MVNWIDSTSCRREGVLTYFQEEKKESKPLQCCDICGMDLEVFSKC